MGHRTILNVIHLHQTITEAPRDGRHGLLLQRLNNRFQIPSLLSFGYMILWPSKHPPLFLTFRPASTSTTGVLRYLIPANLFPQPFVQYGHDSFAATPSVHEPHPQFPSIPTNRQHLWRLNLAHMKKDGCLFSSSFPASGFFISALFAFSSIRSTLRQMYY